MDENNERPPEKPRYKWPWFVLAALILGVALAVLWMSFAVRQAREMRDLDRPPSTGALTK